MVDPNTAATLTVDEIWALCDDLVDRARRPAARAAARAGAGPRSRAASDFDLLVVGDANPDVVLVGVPGACRSASTRQLVDAGDADAGRLGARSPRAARPARPAYRVRRPVGDDALGRLRPGRTGRAGRRRDRLRHRPRPADRADRDPGRRGGDRAILTAPGCLSRLSARRRGSGPRRCGPCTCTSSSYFLQPRLAAGLPGLVRAEIRPAGASTSLDTNDDPSGAWAACRAGAGRTPTCCCPTRPRRWRWPAAPTATCVAACRQPGHD